MFFAKENPREFPLQRVTFFYFCSVLTKKPEFTPYSKVPFPLIALTAIDGLSPLNLLSAKANSISTQSKKKTPLLYLAIWQLH